MSASVEWVATRVTEAPSSRARARSSLTPIPGSSRTAIRARSVVSDAGYTLAELLISTAIMITVTGAISLANEPSSLACLARLRLSTA